MKNNQQNHIGTLSDISQGVFFAIISAASYYQFLHPFRNCTWYLRSANQINLACLGNMFI